MDALSVDEIRKALASEILDAGGFDKDLPDKLLAKERDGFIARGLTVAQATELARDVFQSPDHRKRAIEEIRAVETASFVARISRVPHAQRRNPNALRSAYFAEQERTRQGDRAVSQAMARLKNGSMRKL